MADRLLREPPLVGFVLADTTGGIGRHVHSVARQLADRGQPPYLVAPAAVIDRFGLSEVAATIPAPVGALRGVAAARTAVRRLFATCDVVHAHGFRAGALVARCRSGSDVPFVETWHNAPPASGIAGRVGRELARVAARSADVTLAVSPDLVTLARESGSPDARWMAVAAPPLATVSAADVAATRAALETGGRPLVVAVGRLAWQKGFDVLADAADLLTDDTTSPLIVIAGEGPERPALQGSAVRLLGERPDIAALLAAADLVVLPSRWEGWPLVAQEALRAGRALVATPVGGMPLLAGDAAAWVPPNDVLALAAVIRRLLVDDGERARLADAALTRGRELPDEASVVAELLDLYRTVSRRA